MTPASKTPEYASAVKALGKFQIPADWEDETPVKSGTKFAIVGAETYRRRPS
jgi:hypothetical protein